MMDKAELIPEAKLREACAKCMQHAKHARYFNEAPPGAKQYIALVFFETVFPDDLTEEVSEQCFKEVMQGLGEEDLQYLIACEKDPRTRDVFVERLAYLREENAPQRRQAEKPALPREQPPVVRSAQRAPAPVKPPSVPHGADPVYKLTCDARQLDRSVVAWKRTWVSVCLALVLIFVFASTYALIWYAISKGWLHVWNWRP